MKTRNLKASTEEQADETNPSFFGKSVGISDLNGVKFSDVGRPKILESNVKKERRDLIEAVEK